jgi:GNAT superfamily N-acetyltransferase
MHAMMLPERRRLDLPLPIDFRSGRHDQDMFLRERAWLDQQQRLSTTYLYFVDASVAAYATICMWSILLGTREKPAGVRYRTIAALLLAQLGVDQTWQGKGLGRMVVAAVIELATAVSALVACRYVVLDARPELVGWYERQGFVINKVEQRAREEAAARRGGSSIPVSMRFDLREV